MSTPEKQLNMLHKISNTLEELKDVSKKTLGQAENQNHQINDVKNSPGKMIADMTETNKLLKELIIESQKPCDLSVKLTLK